jgi:hypothetical protein
MGGIFFAFEAPFSAVQKPWSPVTFPFNPFSSLCPKKLGVLRILGGVHQAAWPKMKLVTAGTFLQWGTPPTIQKIHKNASC